MEMTQNPMEKSGRIFTNSADGRHQWPLLGHERHQRATMTAELALMASATSTRMTGNNPTASTGTPYGKSRLTKEHNDANMISIGGIMVSLSLSEGIDIVNTWLDTEFQDGRHQARIDKIETKK
jgi:hypothetical protein